MSKNPKRGSKRPRNEIDGSEGLVDKKAKIQSGSTDSGPEPKIEEQKPSESIELSTTSSGDVSLTNGDLHSSSSTEAPDLKSTDVETEKGKSVSDPSSNETFSMDNATESFSFPVPTPMSQEEEVKETKKDTKPKKKEKKENDDQSSISSQSTRDNYDIFFGEESVKPQTSKNGFRGFKFNERLLSSLSSSAPIQIDDESYDLGSSTRDKKKEEKKREVKETKQTKPKPVKPSTPSIIKPQALSSVEKENAVFSKLNEDNFNGVSSALTIAVRVCKGEKIDTDELSDMCVAAMECHRNAKNIDDVLSAIRNWTSGNKRQAMEEFRGLDVSNPPYYDLLDILKQS